MRGSYHSTDADTYTDLESLGYQLSPEAESSENAATSFLRNNWIALGLLAGIMFVAYDRINLVGGKSVFNVPALWTHVWCDIR